MAGEKLVWLLENYGADPFGTPTDITSQVRSFTYSTGRRTPYDNYNPGYLNITISNDAGQANDYNLNDTIILTAPTQFYQWFWVQEILYNDTGNTGAGSTATIVCTDLLGRMGRIQVFEQSLPQQNTILQVYNAFNSLLPYGTDIFYAGNDGNSIADNDPAYTGTVLNRLNLNVTTEQGLLIYPGQSIYFVSRDELDDALPDPVYYITFQRTQDQPVSILDPFTIGYTNLTRVALGSNYLNTCTVTPPFIAPQNAENSNSISAYGYYGAEFATVDATTGQALGFAQWQVVSRADPDQLSFVINFDDLSNEIDLSFLLSIWNETFNCLVTWYEPGSETLLESQQIIQGFTMSATTQATYIEVYTSPLTYTNFFKLNSATLGILNTSRLGW